jgi:hypothetical protein
MTWLLVQTFFTTPKTKSRTMRNHPRNFRKDTDGVFVEGYWRKEKDAEDKTLPWPEENQVDPKFDMKGFVLQLQILETHPGTTCTRLRGLSKCRLCGKDNGSLEFSHPWKDQYDNQVKWPEGIQHYYQVHQVMPSLEFFSFVNLCVPER